MDDVPALLREAARDTLDALQQLLTAQSQDLAQVHAELFLEYRRELERLFFLYSDQPALVATNDGTPVPAPARQWDGRRFQKELRQDRLEDFAALLDALRDVSLDDFNETLALAADTGYRRALWLLALGGVDTTALLDLNPPGWAGAITHDGFQEVNWGARLVNWSAVTFGKFAQWLPAMALSAATWEATEEGFNRITTSHTQHIAGLFLNECHRAFLYGSGVALDTAERELGATSEGSFVRIWLARIDLSGHLDPRVCPICKAKHMTVTSDRPVDDSHPGCRCITVPVPRTYTPVAPLSFESFTNRAR